MYSDWPQAFPLLAAISTFISNAVMVVLCAQLPFDSMAIIRGTLCYAVLGCVLSMFGILGIIGVSARSESPCPCFDISFPSYRY